jgi:hypothetical protein
MDDPVADYIEAIDPEHRPLFDRLHRLILEVCPDAAVVLSYKMPTYKLAGAQATKDTMTELIVQAQREGWSTRPDTLHLVVLGWAAVHGLAVLWRDGPPADQNEGADPYELSRAVLGTLAAALQARPS